MSCGGPCGEECESGIPDPLPASLRNFAHAPRCRAVTLDPGTVATWTLIGWVGVRGACSGVPLPPCCCQGGFDHTVWQRHIEPTDALSEGPPTPDPPPPPSTPAPHTPPPHPPPPPPTPTHPHDTLHPPPACRPPHLCSNVKGCDCCLAHTSAIGTCFLEERDCGLDYCNCDGLDPSCVTPAPSLDQIAAAWQGDATCPLGACGESYLTAIEDSPQAVTGTEVLTVQCKGMMQVGGGSAPVTGEWGSIPC